MLVVTDEKVLICEGECNPLVKQLKREVRSERQSVASPGGTPLMGYETTQDLRRLRHTTHRRMIGKTRSYACTECGHQRQYGSRLVMA